MAEQPARWRDPPGHGDRDLAVRALHGDVAPLRSHLEPAGEGRIGVVAPGQRASGLAGGVHRPDLTGADGLRTDLEIAAAENVKRVVLGQPDSQSLYEISAFLELKTVWHPIGT